MRRWKAWIERDVRALVHGPPERRVAAVARLTSVRTSGPGSLAPRQSARVRAYLLEAVLRSPDLEVRRDAGYVLGDWCDVALRRSFLAIVADTAQSNAVRAQAAETLGFDLQFERGAVRDEAVAVLRAQLVAPAPALRFWALYALGMLAAKEARSDIASLLHDEAIWCDGWWSVGDEARDVLAVLDGSPWPERLVVASR